jgi:hypothetical protein
MLNDKQSYIVLSSPKIKFSRLDCIVLHEQSGDIFLWTHSEGCTVRAEEW